MRIGIADRVLQRFAVRFLTASGNQLNIPVTAAATTLAVTFVRSESDPAKVGVLVTPNWLTTCSVTNKATTGCTVTFGTAAPASATIDLITFSSE